MRSSLRGTERILRCRASWPNGRRSGGFVAHLAGLRDGSFDSSDTAGRRSKGMTVFACGPGGPLRGGSRAAGGELVKLAEQLERDGS